MMRFSLCSVLCVFIVAHQLLAEDSQATKAVSFQKEIQPILMANCQGCHQPEKRGGGYELSTFSQLLISGESGTAAIVPGKPDESYLVQLITAANGQAEMPKNAAPLTSEQVEKIRLWIQQGALDDTSSTAPQFDQDHLPSYSRAPVVTSIAYSPDGSLLAISGYHEVIVRSGDGAELIARLVGLSERIESVEFSPDGQRLAVAGGQPGRMGELQIWRISNKKLELSIPITGDTVYGASWSPDGSLVAVGATDNVIRAFNSSTGEQVFFNGAHDDWPLATTFSVDGSMIVSAGRDMSTKLYNVPTQRFIDNITSITPGALKGGISAVRRHPTKDEILVGGSDGTPRIYRMERVSARVIGDDANLVRPFPSMQGRIYSVAFSADGNTIACGSSLNGKGQVYVYNSAPLSDVPAEIQELINKHSTGLSNDEHAKMVAYYNANPERLLLTRTELPAAVYALAFHPKTGMIAASGSDGTVRMINPADGSVQSEFAPIELTSSNVVKNSHPKSFRPVHQDRLTGEESVPSGAVVSAIEVQPQSIQLSGPYDSSQILVTGILTSGDRIDLTRIAKLTVNGESIVVSPLAKVFPANAGPSTITVEYGDLKTELPVSVEMPDTTHPLNFIRDVNPVLTRLGCNQGTCHGAKDGKNGFKLSLRGYDPIFDVRAFTDDIKSRRTNVAAPEQSLLLLKASGTVPHVGGQLTRPGEAYYEIIRQWIEEGAQLDHNVERVSSIEIEPLNPVVQHIGARQQIRVIATYTNGMKRDVTSDAFLESSNTEVADVNRSAVVTAIRRGEAPILARFEGNYAATTLTVMGQRDGFVWKQPETWGKIDELVAEKWERMKIEPSGLCSDSEFLRRVYLDLTGLPPSVEALQAFLDDPRPTQEKRSDIVDQLIGSEAYVDYWTNKWSDMLLVNSKFLGSEGASEFRSWIRQKVAANQPYDQFCRDVITASGSNKSNPGASYFKILREPDAIMENTTHLFLAIRFNCNKCHDHPFERWTQDQYYETQAFFAQVELKRDPANQNGDIGGTNVEAPKPLWEEIYDNPNGEVKHDRTGEVTAPLVPFDREIPVPQSGSRREQLADWITSSDNDYFARSYANRVWGYMMGMGLIEPIDDIRAGNPATNPELLDHLTAEFINSGFNVRELMRSICKSRTYQLSIATNKWNEDDTLNYSHANPKRLPAEVLYDTVYTVTGSKMQIPGVPEGTRAAALPDVSFNLQDGFLDSLGRPVRESACECERSSGLQLGPVMALMNGTTVNEAISQSGNRLEQLVTSETDNAALINKIFLNVLNRSAREEEIQAALSLLQNLDNDQVQLIAERDAYVKEIEPVQQELKLKREQAIADAEQQLNRYVESMKPSVEAAEQARQERIASAQAAINEYQSQFPQRLSAWFAGPVSTRTHWAINRFDNLQSTLNPEAKLTQEDSGKVVSTGPLGKGEFVLTGASPLETVTAIEIQALLDADNKGPGRAPNGNFVLTEFTVSYWPKDHPDQKKQVSLTNPKSSFSQSGFDVSTAIDGKTENNGNGWAVSPETNKEHFATFQFAEPVSAGPDVVFEYRMNFQYADDQHVLGQFNLLVTDSTGEIHPDIPSDLILLAETPEMDRTPEQNERLSQYLNRQDEKYQQLSDALAAANQPLPADPKIAELNKSLEETRKPVPEDLRLSRLNRAIELSQKQLENRRLTAAQDLTWALINSPAFLFNR
ncbi:DUF1549 domain-containing protein [Planctomicrobium sp. SH668]|uniref:DUF1549 domain-containing protein n=1 Tax=Planctomicrobium sp. SH668 TaxID=3448126 RepID=UPI003F5BBA7D